MITFPKVSCIPTISSMCVPRYAYMETYMWLRMQAQVVSIFPQESRRFCLWVLVSFESGGYTSTTYHVTSLWKSTITQSLQQSTYSHQQLLSLLYDANWNRYPTLARLLCGAFSYDWQMIDSSHQSCMGMSGFCHFCAMVRYCIYYATIPTGAPRSQN